MIGHAFEARIAPDRHGHPLATLGDDASLGLGAELHERDARRLARMFEQLADRLAEPAPAPRVYGPLGKAVTITDTGESA